ncbi:MAG: DUF3486 family protein [Methylovulum sp.]|nr:DUF3486 family protein [Methylovulum sp.]
MPRPPKVKKHVPKHIRQELNAKLVEDAFLDVDGQTEWLNNRLRDEGITPDDGPIGRNAVYGYMKEYETEFMLSMAEGDKMLQIARAALQTNQDAEGILQEASIRTMQTSLLRLSVSLRELEKDSKADLHTIAKTTGFITKALSDIGRLNISTKKWQQEVRTKLSADLAALKKEGFDGATIDAMERRVAIYLPDNGR